LVDSSFRRFVDSSIRRFVVSSFRRFVVWTKPVVPDERSEIRNLATPATPLPEPHRPPVIPDAPQV